MDEFNQISQLEIFYKNLLTERLQVSLAGVILNASSVPWKMKVCLTHLIPLVSLYTPLKQKTCGFLMFSESL